MPESRAAELQKTLRLLSASYAAQLPERILQLERARDSLMQTWDADGLHLLHRKVHSLTGSAATFGFAAISNVARTLEQTVAALEQQPTTANAEQRAAVLRQTADLLQVMRSSVPPP